MSLTSKDKLDQVREYCLSSDCINLHRVQYKHLRELLKNNDSHVDEMIELFYNQIKAEGGVI